jgi:hypothetical protein
VGSGTYSSAGGAATAQFTVSLASLNDIWYGLEIAALAILVGVFLFIAGRIHLWRALAHASKYFSRGFRSWWRRFWD